MKNYTITVNGNVYDVTVEEKTGDGGVQKPSIPAAPVMAKAPTAKAEPSQPKAAAGGIEVKAGAAGKVFKIEKAAGEQVKKGDAVVIIEAMKMEIPVVAPEDGTVAQIEVTVGDAVEAGAVLATLDPA